MKRTIILSSVTLFIIITGLLSIIATNTLLLNSRQIKQNNSESTFSKKSDNDYSHILSQAIKFKTIATPDQATDNKQYKNEFHKLNQFLANTFPNIHQRLTKIPIANASLLFIWQGKQQNKKPLLLITHSDVVPIETKNLATWKHPPFSGHIDSQFVWGRGTLDNKANLIAQLIAIEELLEQNYQPERTLLLFIGEDEETGGNNGAKQATQYLQKNQLQPGFIIDEGGLITQNILPFMNKPVALIGIAEKGYMSVKLSTTDSGGHASMPPEKSAIGKLNSALHHLQQQKPPHKMTTPMLEMFNYLAPEMKLTAKSLFANLWLFETAVLNQLSATPSTNASIQSTIAITEINGGIAENVLPQTASATINIRLLPGDSSSKMLEFIRKGINDPDVTLSLLPGHYEASAISDTSSLLFKSMQQTIKHHYPQALTAPFLTITATDSRHFNARAEKYRFSAFSATQKDLNRIHGTNERIAREEFNKMSAFYKTLIIKFN